MDRQLWELFRDTGEPMGYLLYRTEDAETAAARQAGERGKEGGGVRRNQS